MRESTRTTIAQNAEPYFEQGETLRAAAPCFQGPRAALFFGLIGMMFIKQRIVAVTDRSVYVLQGSPWSVKRVKGVEARHPLGSVEVTAKKGLPVGTLMIGDQRYSVGKIYQGDAEDVAQAASAGKA